MQKLLVSFAVLSFLAACGGSQPAASQAEPAPSASAPEPQASSAPAEATLPPDDKMWDDMTHDERLLVMRKVVTPTMKAEFQAFDAEKFKDFGCVTCHGAGAKQGKFDMPNPDLPKLNPADGFKAHKEKTPAMLTFMMEKVLPDVAKAIHEKPFDPATKSGFKCVDCHTLVQ